LVDDNAKTTNTNTSTNTNTNTGINESNIATLEVGNVTKDTDVLLEFSFNGKQQIQESVSLKNKVKQES
jgi:hypothetical protein